MEPRMLTKSVKNASSFVPCTSNKEILFVREFPRGNIPKLNILFFFPACRMKTNKTNDYTKAHVHRHLNTRLLIQTVL